MYCVYCESCWAKPDTAVNIKAKISILVFISLCFYPEGF
jgi:hypothetical protein